MPHTDLASYVQSFSYLGIFLWFAIGEQLTPVPEEVYLISVGYIIRQVSLNPVLAGIACVLGLLATDNFLFFISRKGNKISDKIIDKINSNLLEKIKDNLKRNAVKTLLVMALLPKLRFISPIVSGIAGISWRTFLIVNSIATVFYVSVYMLCGMLFHNQLHNLLKKLAVAQHGIFTGVMLILAIVLVFVIRKYVLKSKRENGQGHGGMKPA
jgi:membrane protein DedA with SNARE-associated domain